jgi:hypothetical protein
MDKDSISLIIYYIKTQKDVLFLVRLKENNNK